MDDRDQKIEHREVTESPSSSDKGNAAEIQRKNVRNVLGKSEEKFRQTVMYSTQPMMTLDARGGTRDILQ